MKDNKPYLFGGREEDQSEVAAGIEAEMHADHEVALVDAGGNAVGKAARKRRVRPPGDFMQGFITREEAMKYLAGAVNATSGKMYGQMSSEIADNLEHMEDIILQRVLYVLETRTLRWKIKQLWRRFFPAKLKFETSETFAMPGQEAVVWSAKQVADEFGTDADTETTNATSHEAAGPNSAV